MGKKNSIKKTLIDERGYACEKCHLSTWLNDIISLELEHIDGNNQNNSIENLLLLCPNCHAQTTTYRGKNIKRRVVTDEQLIDALRKQSSIRAALISVGLVGKGANYERAKRLILENQVDFLNHVIEHVVVEKSDAWGHLKRKVKQSDIDFTKYGWCSKLSEIIGISPQKARQWLKREMPDLYKISYMRDSGEAVETRET